MIHTLKSRCQATVTPAIITDSSTVHQLPINTLYNAGFSMNDVNVDYLDNGKADPQGFKYLIDQTLSLAKP